MGEPALIERLVANLLDNGIRHNEPGGFLEVGTTRRGGRVRLHVRNGGPRIDPAEASQLVQPFRRLHRSVDGFGLGLSIVRMVAEAHGGTATIVAPADGGLDVFVDLPALATPPALRSREDRRALTTT
jgi:signal transduction histidine kinase